MTKISTSFRRALGIAAAAALVAGLSAPAQAVKPPKGDSASEQKGSAPAPEKKICLATTVSGADTVTGSILQKKKCKTKAQWIAEGVQFGRK